MGESRCALVPMTK